jgi:hypothetical protein
MAADSALSSNSTVGQYKSIGIEDSHLAPKALNKIAALLLALRASIAISIPSSVLTPLQIRKPAKVPIFGANAVLTPPPVAKEKARALYDWQLDSHDDPVARREEAGRKKKQDEFRLNVGEAYDSLNTDIPLILRAQPNWGIYTEDLELDITNVGEVEYRLFGAIAGLGVSKKLSNLEQNKEVLRKLHNFRRTWIQKDEIKARTVSSLKLDDNGDKMIECRWNAHITMKRDEDLIPYWAAVSLGFVRRHTNMFPPTPARDFIIDGVSRFYVNSNGRVYRHVIDKFQLTPPLKMPEVDDMLWMIGMQRYPKLAPVYFKP